VNEHDAIARIKRLSHSINCADEIAEVIERLIKERDEARRRICETTDMTNPNDDCYVRLTPQQIAKHYGWDCFKTEFFVGDDDHAKEGL
jgi:hypothetical protein